MGACTSTNDTAKEPREKNNAVTKDYDSDDEDPEVEGALPRSFEPDLDDTLSGTLEDQPTHPALHFKKKHHLRDLLRKSDAFDYDRLPKIVRSAKLRKMLEELNINYNIHSEKNKGYLGKKELMDIHGLPHVQRHLKPHHASDLFAKRLYAHYAKHSDENNPLHNKIHDGHAVNEHTFIHGFSKLHSDVSPAASKESIFDIYDIDNNKAFITKDNFRKMARSLVSSASLAPEFRLDSLWFGIGHSSNFDDEVENALDEYVDAVFRGEKQISKKDFLFYVENVDEIKHLNHGRESARPAPQPDDSPPVIPTRIPRPKVPPTHDQKTEPELTGSENSALEVIKNEDGESENETMEEVMRKLRETDVAIHAVHTVTTTPTGGDDNDIES